MNFIQEVHNSWHIISRNKIRSFLTMLGVTIGVASVIIVISVGAGAQSLIVNQIKSLGSDLVGVLPGKADEKGPPVSVFGVLITSLKDEDGQAIMKSAFPHLVNYTSYVKGTDTVTWRDEKTDTTFVGVKGGFTEVEDAPVASGRFFTDEEDRSLSRVAVLASQTANDLFGDEEPIGQNIKIKKTNFNIIGVMKARGSSGFQNQDNQIFVPLETAQKLLLGINYVSFMRFKVDSPENVNESMDYIRQILRDRHNITNPVNDDFDVRSMAQGLETLSTITNALRLFMAAIAAISLVVGGIGIMNIMLAAVQERTKEIGLRKAVGAKSRNIVGQFLIETCMITLMAGIFGIILGVGISVLVALVAKNIGYGWDLVISIPSIVMGCVVSVGIGLIFGILPAKKASELDPIEALRYE